MTGEPFDTPTRVEAVDGEVHLNGPDGIAVAMTPLAAAETAERLFEAAAEARGQQIIRDNDAALNLRRKDPGAAEG